MKWVIEISSSAEKEIEVLQDKMAQRIVDAIFHLAENPFPRGYKKLEGVDGYRIRVGPFRILYRLEKKSRVITIYGVRHRKEAYR